jgi:DNA-binding transcriptional LysR family regulator
MEMQQLRYFLAVADRLHFTEAAKLLNVVQPAISRQVRLLEEEVGVRLLERTNRRVQLTPAGRAFQKRARVALEQAEAAATEARKIDRGEAGTLPIGYTSSTELFILPQVLKLLRQEIPAATVQLVHLGSSEQLDALHKETIDLGLTSNLVVNVIGLKSRLMSSETLVVALPERHPLARRRIIDLKWLSGEQLLLPPPLSPHGVREQIVEACLNAGFNPKVEQTVLNAQTAVCLVAGEVGVALVPECFRNMSVKGVVYRPLRMPICQIDFYAIRRKGDDSALLNRLWDRLSKAENLRSIPAKA